MHAHEAQSGQSGIDLAMTKPFELGSTRVEPARRLILWGANERRELEPRVMQVLVALASARGETVSRDRLVELCWNGRVVGDDAISRCIQSLRKLAREIEPHPYTIETIPRVGYLLAAEPADGQAQGHATTSVRKSPAGRPRARIATAAILVTAVLAALGFLLWPSPTDRPTQVAVAAEGGGTSEAIARGLRVDLSRLAGAHVDQLAVVDQPAGADFLVRVSVSEGADVVRANLSLLRRGARELIWSGAVDLPAPKVGNLQSQLSAKISNAMDCALKMRNARRMAASTARLFMAACEQMDEQPDQTVIDQFRRVTEEASGFANGWAYLALAEAEVYFNTLAVGGGSRTELQPVRVAALEHLRRARSLDPGNGVTYVAEADLLERNGWAKRLPILREGIRRDPQEARLHERLAFNFFQLGRTTEAIAAATRAAALKPLSARSRAGLIASLAHAGIIGSARRELAEAERMWPESPDIRDVRFSIELRYGDARIAQQMIDRGETSVGGSIPGVAGPDTLMRARLDPEPGNVARVIRLAAFGMESVPRAAPFRLQALGQFGAVEEAYQVLQQPGVIGSLRNTTEILFRPHLREVRYDRRFPAVTEKLGLLRYWHDSGEWPDFCADPRLPYDCRAEAARLLTSRPGADAGPPPAAS